MTASAPNARAQPESSAEDAFDFAKRTEILDWAFAVDVAKTTGKRLSLFDDLYRSGATVSAITRLPLIRKFRGPDEVFNGSVSTLPAR